MKIAYPKHQGLGLTVKTDTIRRCHRLRQSLALLSEDTS